MSNGMSDEQLRQIMDHAEGVTGTSTNTIDVLNQIEKDSVDKLFSYKSSDVNLTYKNLLPFLGAYLIYKFLWKM